MRALVLAMTAAAGLSAAAPSAVEAACGATVNGRPMSIELCQTVWQIYGGVAPGHYQVDQAGNWINLANPAHRGNLYRDAQRGGGGLSGGSGGSGGMTRTPFGSVGGGYYFDNETGASVGP